MGRVLPGAQFGTRSMQREPAADPVRLGLIRVSTLQPSSELGNQHPRGLGTHGRDARATVDGDPGAGRPCHSAWGPWGGTPVPRGLGTHGRDARATVLGDPGVGRSYQGAWEPSGGTPVPRCLGTLGWDARTKVLGNPRAGRPCRGAWEPTGGTPVPRWMGTLGRDARATVEELLFPLLPVAFTTGIQGVGPPVLVDSSGPAQCGKG